MKMHLIAIAAATTLMSASAMAQTSNEGAAAGAATGAIGGAIVGGPVGAVVGGAVGALAGGGLSQQDRVYVDRYVVAHPRDSVRVQGELEVGAVLPPAVEFYEIEGRPYRYAYVNGRPVVVDSGRRIVYVR